MELDEAQSVDPSRKPGPAGRADRFVWHSLFGLSVRAVEVLTKLALYMLAARWLGQQESGLLFLAMTWGQLASTASRLGIERALTRLLAAELALGQGLSARRLMLAGGATNALAGVLVGLATFLLAPLAAVHLFHDPDATAPLRASGFVIPAMTVAFTLANILTGLGRTTIAQILQNVSWPVGLLIGLLCGQTNASHLVGTFAVTMGLTVAVGLLVVMRDRDRLARDVALPADATALPSLRATAAPLYVVELVQVSIASLPVLILGIYVDTASISLFSVAQRASMMALVILISLGTVASPRYAGLHRQRDTGLGALNRRVQIGGALIGGSLCLVLVLGARPLLSVISAGFVGGAGVLAVLALGQMANALYAAQDILLAMTGHGAVLRLLNLAQLAAILLLSFLLIPRFGLMGAAIATALCTAQGGIGTAMAAGVLVPEASPLFVPPLPRPLRTFFMRFAP
jgi:O-antigen/teichoic acid export membrane protein